MRTQLFTCTSLRRGICCGPHRIRSLVPQKAKKIPPIPPSTLIKALSVSNCRTIRNRLAPKAARRATSRRSEEHTSELQSPYDLVCRLLLEKKNEVDHS